MILNAAENLPCLRLDSFFHRTLLLLAKKMGSWIQAQGSVYPNGTSHSLCMPSPPTHTYVQLCHQKRKSEGLRPGCTWSAISGRQQQHYILCMHLTQAWEWRGTGGKHRILFNQSISLHSFIPKSISPFGTSSSFPHHLLSWVSLSPQSQLGGTRDRHCGAGIPLSLCKWQGRQFQL